MSSKVRIGFVGVGGMGQCAHLRNYVTLPDCEVVALSELRPKLGQMVGQRYGISKVYTDHREMLKHEKLDALVQIQGFTFHAQLLPQLFEYGLPVITEKPIASTIAAGEQIVDALHRSKAKYYVAYHKRSDPATMYVRDMIDAWKKSGQFGAMRYIRITMPPGDWVANGFLNLLMTDEKIPPMTPDPKPGDMEQPVFNHYVWLVNYYIHQVNLMRHLLTEDYTVSAAESAGILMTVKSKSGVTGLLEMSPYGTTVDWQEVAMVCFEKAWLKLELPAPLTDTKAGRVTVYTDAGSGQIPMQCSPTLPWVHAMRQQAINFVKAVRGEGTPLCSAEDALKDLRSMKEYLDLYLKAGGKVG